MDEKSSVQALDRTQPSLPMKKGRAGTMTHDYKRNGTTTLFAALNVLTGVVIGECLPRHRHEEFLKFLHQVDREVPKGVARHRKWRRDDAMREHEPAGSPQAFSNGAHRRQGPPLRSGPGGRPAAALDPGSAP